MDSVLGSRPTLPSALLDPSFCEAMDVGQAFYNKCGALVDLSGLNKALQATKRTVQQLKILEVEGIMSAACSEKRSDAAVAAFKAQLEEIAALGVEHCVPAALVAEARKVVEAATAAKKK